MTARIVLAAALTACLACTVAAKLGALAGWWDVR